MLSQVMRYESRSFCVLASLLMLGCASFKPDTSLPATVVASPNYDMRHPTMIVIHYTSNNDPDRSIQTLTSPVRKVSAHYLIDEQGRLFQLVPENQRAWHAGQSYWGGNSDLNSVSIGIELDNSGSESFQEGQIKTLMALVKDIQTRHRIKAMNVVGHSDIAPGRKVDPGPYFPWKRLAASGIGIWCNDPSVAKVKEGVDLNDLLVKLGYDPRIPEKTRSAFRSHYLSDGNGSITVDNIEELMVAQCLVDQVASSPSNPASAFGAE